MTRTRAGKQALLFIILFGLIVLGSGCAKKQIESQPSDLQMESMEKAEETSGPGTMQEAAEEESLSEAEEYQLQQEEAEAAKKEADEQARKEKVQKLQELIHFDFDSYELSPEARTILQQKAEMLESEPEIKLMIEGHCDERGTEEYNLALGERRARAAYEYLVLLGISPDRLSIISFGEEKPLDPGHTEQAWAKNRRAQFRIMQ